MSKLYTGLTTNGVTELTLQEEGVGNIGTQTIVWDDTQGTIDQVMGAIPDNWKNLDDSLKQLQIGTSCTSIGTDAFNNCTGLTGSLVIPDSVTTIGNYVFWSCGFTGTLTIGNSVTSIANFAFYDCTGFTSLVVPNSVASIGAYAFGFCSSITALYTNTPAASWAFAALNGTTALVNIYTGPNATGYDAAWKITQGTSAIVSTWTNYPDIP